MFHISNVFWGLAGIGTTFFLHIFFVTVVLGLSVIIPIFEIIGYVKKDEGFFKFARRLTSYLIRVDLFAGVLATWLTVFLAAYWPSLVYIATNVLFYPISLAVAGIMIAIVSTALYWYTWEEMKRRTHIVVGLFMAAGALLVPFGMNSILALMYYPYGVKVSTALGLTFFGSNGLNPLANPIFLPLALFTWFVSIALASFIVLTFAVFRSKNDFTDEFQKTLKTSKLLSLIFSLLSVLTITWTILELRNNSQYVYLQMTNRGFVAISLSIAAIVAVFSVVSLFKKGTLYGAPTGAAATYILLMFFEVASNTARYPYLIVTNSNGISANTLINPMFNIPSILPIAGIGLIVVAMATLMLTLYLTFYVYPVAGKKKTTT
ncbi:MAG: cytochrome ubiquinol oxidase subunit I [Thermoplasmatales archaeon]